MSEPKLNVNKSDYINYPEQSKFLESTKQINNNLSIYALF